MLPLVDSRSVHKTKMGSESNHVRWFPLARAGEAGSGGWGRCENVYVWHVGDYPKSDALVDRKSTSTDARQAGWIGRSAKTVMCPRAARVHRTSNQAPRSHHIVIEILDLLLVGRSGWAPGVRMHDSMTGSMIGSSPVPLATLCALCVPLRRGGERLCGAPPLRAVAIPYCAGALRAALRGARALRAAARRSGAPRPCIPACLMNIGAPHRA